MAHVEKYLAEPRLLQLARYGQIVGDRGSHGGIAADGLECGSAEHDDLADGEGECWSGDYGDEPQREKHGRHDVGCRDDALLTQAAQVLLDVAGEAIGRVGFHVRHGPGQTLGAVNGVRIREKEKLPVGEGSELLHGMRLAHPPRCRRGHPLPPLPGPGIGPHSGK